MTDVDKPDLNREIADALTALGMDEGLAWRREGKCHAGHLSVPNKHGECTFTEPMGMSRFYQCHEKVTGERIPHDFTDYRYLLPALEALKYDVEWCRFENETESGWNVQLADDEAVIGVASEPTLGASLQHALYVALTGGL